MSRFLDRYLPVGERRTALWLALGGAGVVWAGRAVYWTVLEAVPVGSGADAVPVLWAAQAISALSTFAMITLLLAALFKAVRPPKELALYLALAAVLGLVLDLVQLPLAFMRAAEEASGWGLSIPGAWPSWIGDFYVDVALLAGVTAGAWIAQTVTLARIRDAGFSGDAPDGTGLRVRADRIGLSFLGWHGRPVAGDALIALAFVLVQTPPRVVNLAMAYLLQLPSALRGSDLSWELAQRVNVAHAITGLLVWALSTYWVVRRTRVRAAWLGAAAVLGAAMLSQWQFGVRLFLDGDPQGAGMQLLFSGNALLPVLAALAGTELALRARPATLSSDEPQDPASPPAPLDTQESTDE